MGGVCGVGGGGGGGVGGGGGGGVGGWGGGGGEEGRGEGRGPLSPLVTHFDHSNHMHSYMVTGAVDTIILGVDKAFCLQNTTDYIKPLLFSICNMMMIQVIAADQQ